MQAIAQVTVGGAPRGSVQPSSFHDVAAAPETPFAVGGAILAGGISGYAVAAATMRMPMPVGIALASVAALGIGALAGYGIYSGLRSH